MIDRRVIASMLGITVEQLRRSVEPRPDFPTPALRLSRKTVRWERADVERWIEAQRQRAQRSRADVAVLQKRC
jgi:predicted DNA-binding transcriptional regulator AlpA